MSMIAQIADAVAAKLNAASFSQAFTAERSYQPNYELADLETLRVTVVPRGVEIIGASRRMTQFDHQIDIGVQKRLSPDPESDRDEIDALTGLVEEIANALRFEPLETVPAASWAGMTHEPIVSGEHLDEQRQFTSVLSVTYRALR